MRTGSVLALIAALGLAPARQQPVDAPPKPGRELSRGQTVVLGTYRWDIEANLQQAGPGVDVWWEQVRVGEQYLVPMAGVGLVVVAGAEFDKLSRDDLATLTFGRDRLASAALTPGAVVAVRTVEGNLAKLQIVGYRDSHDFAFESAKFIPTDRQQAMLSRPKVDKRHLEVSWVLYEKLGPAR